MRTTTLSTTFATLILTLGLAFAQADVTAQAVAYLLANAADRSPQPVHGVR